MNADWVRGSQLAMAMPGTVQSVVQSRENGPLLATVALTASDWCISTERSAHERRRGAAMKMLNEPEFRDPPTPKRGRPGWVPLIDKVRANPGRWALVAYNPGGATKGNLMKWFPGLEVMTVGSGEKRELWVRWPEQIDGEGGAPDVR